jgi:hypothetical protein
MQRMFSSSNPTYGTVIFRASLTKTLALPNFHFEKQICILGKRYCLCDIAEHCDCLMIFPNNHVDRKVPRPGG